MPDLDLAACQIDLEAEQVTLPDGEVIPINEWQWLDTEQSFGILRAGPTIDNNYAVIEFDLRSVN